MTLSMQNPVFIAYAIAASIMILKIMGQGYMTVYRMMKIEAGFVAPEDLLLGPINRNPHPKQLELNDYVDRSRRIHRNDLENIPAFLVVGLLFVAVSPPYALAVILMATFVIMRLIHTIVYATGQRHEVRAAPYTIASLIVIFMALYVLIAAARAWESTPIAS
jgi:glutathione S-transferase